MSMTVTVTAVTLDQVNAILADQDTLDNVLGADSSREVSLEKAWHGLHFLLTGSSAGGTGPEAFLLAGGQPIGGNRGYGPARLFRPESVHALAASLSALSDEQLWKRFDAERMTAECIYPVIWDEAEDELQSEYLGYYRELKKLVASASQAGDGLVIVLE
jgi:hypothetical protein